MQCGSELQWQWEMRENNHATCYSVCQCWTFTIEVLLNLTMTDLKGPTVCIYCTRITTITNEGIKEKSWVINFHWLNLMRLIIRIRKFLIFRIKFYVLIDIRSA